MNQIIIERLIKELELKPLKNDAISISEIEVIENKLNVKFHKDFVDFFNVFGETDIAGLTIFPFRNEINPYQTIINLTTSFREEYSNDIRNQIFKNSYVISFDGCGNNIIVSEKGQVVVIYHDCDEYEIFADSFTEFIEKILDNELEDKW